ncbi:glycosyltransferase family 4 protein [Salinimicrobium sp. TH3]|uniref:glycosyltransferase family 4 protein n=1 Tax=Salinimicrobium sp. TH3 TaxID=2997342 RepID=UPI0022752B6F|nr:glycosyltransferase family 1 protein [Salinimicrobium sp. TH3]MCY2687946.1 glycosyltransferase family 1 protein [Salinimicrobium sp. TH3]
MRSSTTAKTSLRVNYFQRRPRKGFNFSLEFIYDDLRRRLQKSIEPTVFISSCYNNGYLSKIFNILEAGLKQGNDINHITGELHFLNILMNRKKVVLTILDCGMIKRKKGLEKIIVNWFYLSLPISRARIITAISEETKKEILHYSKCDSDKIKVIPVPVSSIFQPFAKDFNQIKPVILQVGTTPNKNLLRLIQALEGLECHLSIVGKLSVEQLEALDTYKIEFSNEFNITDERLLEKYQECDLLSFISTFEGFGMPIVEAQMVERPVITANTSSMPEVAGRGAYLVDPFNVMEIRSGIREIIQNKELRSDLIELGKVNRKRFDGDLIAKMYLEVYKECMGKNL